jgi:cell division septum initiation protein DivIVA
MDILRQLDKIKELTVDRPRRLGPFYWNYDSEEAAIQIAKTRASLPSEVKAAVQTVRESERIVDTARVDATAAIDSAQRESDRVLAEARKEAELIIEQAKLQQERLVSESEILKLAKAQSEEIRNSAEKDSREIRRGAEKYAYDMLAQLEGVMSKVMSVVSKGKEEMDRTPEAAIIQVRERVKS